MHRYASTRWALYFFLATVVLFLGALAPSSQAQTAETGALTGVVSDSTGAVVPNATVTVTSPDTGQVRTAQTGPDGSYKVGLLHPGNYRVRFEAAGFQTTEVPAATINVTETDVLNEALQVGSQSQEVTVQANVETVQTASSALGTVVNTETVSDLPLNTRNYTNLLAMSAGANASASNASTIGKGSSLIAVNGGGDAQNTYLQDGVSVMNWFSFGTNTEGTEYGALAIPNPDTIAEFKIQTSSYDAGYGRNPGANVNVVTKSGTNDFHGTAFEFFRNAVLNANDFFYEYSELSRGLPNKQAALSQNQYGGVFGGPIKKDKLFFFVSYQGTAQKNGLTGYGVSNVTLPALPNIPRGTCTTPNWTSLSQCDANTAAFVTALGNANCLNIPTAAGSTVHIQGTTAGCQAPTNPLNNINPVAVNILQLKLANGAYLLPSVNNGAGGFVSIGVPAIFHDYQGLGNFDYVVNSTNTLSVRYDYETDPLDAELPVINATLPGTALPGNPVNTTKTDHAGLVKLTTILTPNLVNEARISYQRYITNDTVNSPFTDTQVGVTPLCMQANEACGKYGNQLSFFTIGVANLSGFAFGAHYFYGVYVPENQFEYSDQVSWTHGKHAFRFGFEAQRIQADQNYPSIAIGAPTFSTFADFLVGRAAGSTASGGNGGTASNVTGGIGGSTAANGGFPFEFRDTNLSGYMQDDFKFSSRLTLNLGVRWEYDGYLSEKYGNFANFWPTLDNAQPNPGSGCVIGSTALGAGATGTGCSLVGFVVPSNYNGPKPTGLYQNSNQTPTVHGAPWDNFAPRLGFAYQPLSTSKWVVRGGAGYFFDLLAGEDVGNPVTLEAPGPGIPVPSSTSASLQSPGILPASIPGPVGSYGFAPRWVNFGATPNTTVTSSNLDPKAISQFLRTPLTYEWNLNTQYEFLPNWVLEVGYVGTHGIHQLAQSQGGAQGQSATEQYNWASLASPTNPINGITSNTSTNASGRVPYLGLNPTDAWVTSTDDYKYNSLQVTLRKQLSHGLQLQAAYTWSRGFIGIPYGINTAPYVVNRYDLNPAYRPQRLVLNYVWNLPLGHPEALLGRVTDGWTVSGVTTIQDGTPLTVTDSTGGTLFFGPAGGLSTGNFCSGMGNGNILTSGSLVQRVVSGLAQSSTGARTGSGFLNGLATEPGQAVFCAPPTGSAVNPNFPITGTGTGFGNSGPGAILGPGQDDWDMSLAKVTKVGGLREDGTLQFRAEFFNTFNHPSFSNPSVALRTAQTYGAITTASVSPRVIQLALKYSF